MQDLQPLNTKLVRIMNYIYQEWLHTRSMQALRRELEANNPIITKMVELEISIT